MDSAPARPTAAWILGDQLTLAHPALRSTDEPVVLVEAESLLRRLRYHRKKLVLLLSAMRHFAEALRERGFTVHHLQAPTMGEGLRRAVGALGLGALRTMEASSHHGAAWQRDRAPVIAGVPVEILPNTMFLVGRWAPPPPRGSTRMETFYRAMRRHFDVLMTPEGEPVGGEWNYDVQNRKPLPASLTPPEPPRFPPDAITRGCMDEVARRPDAFGSVDGFAYAVTAAQAWEAFEDFLDHRLPLFGPYEDAMSSRSDTLYHAVLAPYMNLGLLDPMAMVRAAEQRLDPLAPDRSAPPAARPSRVDPLAPDRSAPPAARPSRVDPLALDRSAPPAARPSRVDPPRSSVSLPSVEGFVRQVMGWREFMYWRYRHAMPDLAHRNHWRATRPVPAFFWSAETDLACLRHALRRVLEHGYTHHIERLMLLSSFCVLAGIDPQEATAWFAATFVDAYDWVMQPNAIGMGLNADGGLIASKPYIASAHYIQKMGDYCRACPYDAKQRLGERACPFNALYWSFLIEHEDELRRNPRMGPAVLGLRHLADSERQAVRAQARTLLSTLVPDARP